MLHKIPQYIQVIWNMTLCYFQINGNVFLGGRKLLCDVIFNGTFCDVLRQGIKNRPNFHDVIYGCPGLYIYIIFQIYNQSQIFIPLHFGLLCWQIFHFLLVLRYYVIQACSQECLKTRWNLYFVSCNMTILWVRRERLGNQDDIYMPLKNYY